MKQVIAGMALLALAACGGGADNPTAPAASGPVAAVPAPAGQDWTQTVGKTAEGGFVMGNPDAAVKLVEFGSLTCSHCADFSKQATGALKEKIAQGKLSWEFRNYVRDPLDVTAALLARCNGPAPFFTLTEQMYESQTDWFAKMQTAAASMQGVEKLPPEQQFGRYAQAVGLDQFVAQRGMPAAKAQACLADKAETDRLVAMVESANKLGLTGTPTFLINGRIVPNAANWEQLRPALTAAGV